MCDGLSTERATVNLADTKEFRTEIRDYIRESPRPFGSKTLIPMEHQAAGGGYQARAGTSSENGPGVSMGYRGSYDCGQWKKE